MHIDERTVLRTGESLSSSVSLVSGGGAFALEHRPGGELVLRDRARTREVWKVGPVPAGPGRLVLMPDGYLVLVDRSGRPFWRSGDVDRRVGAAVLTDDGRLVLVDPDGFPRWSRDPLTDTDLASCRPAAGDRLTRGQRLDGPLVSANGRYLLSVDPAGQITLVRERGGMVWSRGASAQLTLGHDGMLRTGADSTLLARWAGRRLDPAAYPISALIVGDDGDLVLIGADGSEVYRSGTAAEEARLDELQEEYARRERENDAKPLRPRDSGLPADWFHLFDPGPDFPHYSITLVHRIPAREALLRLGVEEAQIASMTFADLAAIEPVDDDMLKRVFAVQFGDWVMLIELDALDAADEIEPLSLGTRAVVSSRSYDGEDFLGWAIDGTSLAVYWDDGALERGAPAGAGTQPDAIVPFLQAVGLGRFRDTRYDDHFLPPALEVACLIADVRPRPEHFAGEHLGAVSPW
ncbi:DUF6461 domain-containing protein [Actinoplanes sp. NPDC026619]|uniref:DUF6461 domain-containing protein n=1 Tax=Actinoplanes sp. NPDC026619 TaxID=3155798 RepID=UPI0033DC3C1A